jgi:CheY-like chemotaxis protein
LAKDGEEAIAYLSGAGMYAERKRFPMPDLVLLDLKMPGRDGFEVLEWIRSRGELGGLPVIVMTTSDVVKDVNRAYAAGANSFLVKPTEVENFMGLLRAMNAFWLQQARRPKVTAQRVGEDARLESGASLNV